MLAESLRLTLEGELLGRERNRESDGDGLGATLGGADFLL